MSSRVHAGAGRRAARAFAAGVVLLSAAHCASTPRAHEPVPPDAAALLATLPEAELGTQRILRAQYDGPEGKGGFRLVLRLEAAERYDLTAVDGAGRTLWRLRARPTGGLFEDVAAERYCRLDTAAHLPGGLGLDLPLGALPKVLLGRLPLGAEPPAGSGSATEGDRRWTWTVAAGELERWTLWRDGQPAVWWSRRGAEATLSVRGRATQVRWQTAVREPIGRALEDLVPPAGWEEGACDARDLS